MKKLLMILIFLFIFFEVKPEQRLEDINIKDCLLILRQGIIIHQKNEELSKDLDGLTRVQTIFVFKTKTYVHSLIFKGSELKESSCKVLND